MHQKRVPNPREGVRVVKPLSPLLRISNYVGTAYAKKKTPRNLPMCAGAGLVVVTLAT